MKAAITNSIKRTQKPKTMILKYIKRNLALTIVALIMAVGVVYYSFYDAEYVYLVLLVVPLGMFIVPYAYFYQGKLELYIEYSRRLEDNEISDKNRRKYQKYVTEYEKYFE